MGAVAFELKFLGWRQRAVPSKLQLSSAARHPIPGVSATENRAHRAFCRPFGRESRSRSPRSGHWNWPPSTPNCNRCHVLSRGRSRGSPGGAAGHSNRAVSTLNKSRAPWEILPFQLIVETEYFLFRRGARVPLAPVGCFTGHSGEKISAEKSPVGRPARAADVKGETKQKKPQQKPQRGLRRDGRCCASLGPPGEKNCLRPRGPLIKAEATPAKYPYFFGTQTFTQSISIFTGSVDGSTVPTQPPPNCMSISR